ncbi:cellulase family glycosylhydrolase [Geofilum sp. OHC36d9]|uniref:cellulase family glycosylhydrolase n=1 Tax=Geofilum sp. OHC36d9 TaxID=3458413 RepID=UPI004034BCAB
MGFKSKIVGAIILFAGVLASCHKEPYSVVFSTNEGFLQDANGSEFLIRGVNVPFAWHPVKSYQALDEIARQKANCVRIVWESSLPASGLDSILQKSIDLNMIPIVELHDATGDSTATKLYQMATYFVSDEMKSVIQKYESYLLINIANEWGDNNLKAEYWRDAYKECISLLRNSGYRSTIVIDAPGWGQNIDPVLLYGQALIDYDPLHNLLFSIHMYGSWNDEEKIRHALQDAVNQSLPIVVGEFGYHYNEGNNNLNCKVNHEQILEVCAELNIGFLAWSWSGNNEVNQWLDLVTNDDWKTLTDWGKAIFNSPLGIKETARKASVFND